MLSHILPPRIRFLFTVEQWAIGVVRAPIAKFLDPNFRPTVKWISAASNREALTDPFGIIWQGRRVILAEHMRYKGASMVSPTGKWLLGRGYISSLALDDDANVVAEQPAIDTGAHMSYPFTLQHQGRWYCVAEDVVHEAVVLYELCDNKQWKPTATLLNRGLVDPSLVFYNGLWWMFGTTPTNPLRELLIFHAETLHGPWVPHPHRSARLGSRGVRSGGTPFLCDGALFRPAQSHEGTYGRSIIINRIDTLTREAFVETPVREVLPVCDSKYKQGTHTLSAFGDWTLIDGKRNVFLPSILPAKIGLRVRRQRWRKMAIPTGKSAHRPFSSPEPL